MAVLATLPLLTFVLTRRGVSGIEAVGIALFVGAIVIGWRRGANTHDAFAANAWAVGARAEVETARALDRLTDPHTVVLHDLGLAGRRENIDHLVISTRGVVVVETKRWTGSVVVGRTVRHNWRRRRDVIDQAERLRRSVSRAIEGIPVDAFVCIHGARVRRAWFRRRASIDGVAFGDTAALVRHLRRRRRVLRPADVRRLAGELEVVTPR